MESGIIYNSTKIDRLLLSWCICFTTFSEVVAQCCWSGSGMLIQATFTTTIPLLPVARHNAVSRSLWKYIVRQFNMPSRDRHFLTSFRFTVCSSSLCCLHKNRGFYFKTLHRQLHSTHLWHLWIGFLFSLCGNFTLPICQRTSAKVLKVFGSYNTFVKKIKCIGRLQSRTLLTIPSD